MSEHESDSDIDQQRTSATSTYTPSTTANRAAARALKKQQMQEKEEEINTLRQLVTSLQEQHRVDRGIVESLEHQMVQVKMEEQKQEQSAAATSVPEHHGAGNAGIVDGSGGDAHAHVHRDMHASDDDDDIEYVSHPRRGDGSARGVKPSGNGPIVMPRMPASLKTFSGEGGASVRSWLQQYEAIRMPLQWDDRMSIAVAAMQLTDRAQQWYQEEGIKKPASSSWKQFKAALLRRFTPVINQLFIPKYTRDIAQRAGEKSVDFMDRVRIALRDLGVDEEEQVVRVFSSGLNDWIMEHLTMVVGDDHTVSAKDLLDHCNRIELAKSVRHGTHFDARQRDRDRPGGTYHPPPRGVPLDQAHRRDRGYVPAYPRPVQNGMVTSNQKLQLNRNDSCKICGQSGHWARECPNRGGTGAGPANARPGGVNVAVNVGGGKVCSHCGKAGHLVDQCFTLKNQQRREEAAHPGRGAVPPGRAAIRTVRADEHGDRDDRNYVRMIGMVTPEERGVFALRGCIGTDWMWCTLDTGADRVSCLSDAFFSKLPLEYRKHLAEAQQNLYSVDGVGLRVLGVATLPIRFQTSVGLMVEMDVKFHVISGLGVSCLLGSNFCLTCGKEMSWGDPEFGYFTLWSGEFLRMAIRDANEPTGMKGEDQSSDIATLITSTNDRLFVTARHERLHGATHADTVALKQALPNASMVVASNKREDGTRIVSNTTDMLPREAKYSIRLIRNITIPANSVMAVPYAKAYIGSMDEGTSLMAQGNDRLYRDGIMVAHTMHETSSNEKDKQMVLQVTNTTSRPVSYRRGHLVGSVEPVDMMAVKESEEIHKSSDKRNVILRDIEEKIQEESDDSALTTSHDKQVIMDVLSQYTHLFDDRFMGEARQ